MITHNDVVQEIRDRIKTDVEPGLHKAWVNKILMIVDDVETIADEMISRGVQNYEPIE
jgi:hypothetical protein|tara:strand:- start:428 stop:601 length:174 start_codon:yes stop_codon:yes gene_type:complete